MKMANDQEFIKHVAPIRPIPRRVAVCLGSMENYKTLHDALNRSFWIAVDPVYDTAPDDWKTYDPKMVVSPKGGLREYEADVFWRMNFCKWKAHAAVLEAADVPLVKRNSMEIIRWAGQANAARDLIAGANMPLALHNAQKMSFLPYATYEDMISECNLRLVMCIDKFHPGRGLRFSSYATVEMFYCCRRLSASGAKWNRTGTTEYDDHLSGETYDPFDKLFSGPDILQAIKDAELDDRETAIIMARFGLDGGGGAYLKECGRLHGITKERVRQVQARAMRKLAEQF
jgi:RNA polymerase sigma factor (sigma-70 family)